MAARKVVLVGLMAIAAVACLSQAAPMEQTVTAILRHYATEIAYTRAPTITGGYGDARPGDEHAQKLADSVKSDILKQAALGAAPAEFVVEKYKTQVVNGYNTALKIRVAAGKYLHTTVYQPFSKEASPKATVSRVETSKSLQDSF